MPNKCSTFAIPKINKLINFKNCLQMFSYLSFFVWKKKQKRSLFNLYDLTNIQISVIRQFPATAASYSFS